MRKSTLFISAVLTTFALVMLYRVASAYNDNRKVAQVGAAAATSAPEAAATDAPADIASADAAPQPVVLGPEQAAQLAAKVVNNTNLLSAETSSFNGLPAYLITFTNNDVVYIGLDGQILSVQIAPVTPVVVNVPVPAATKAHKNKNSGVHSSSPSGGDYSGDDHEEHDD